jgi:hypothetical protein
MAIVNIFTSETVSNIFKIGYNFLCLAMNLLTSAVFYGRPGFCVFDSFDCFFLFILDISGIYP